MFEFFLQEAFSFMASIGIDKFDELKKQYTNQRILQLTIKQFAESSLFKTEYKNVIFNKNDDEILTIPSEHISPILEAGQIMNNIIPVMDKIFICDDRNTLTRIFKTVTMQYVTKNKLTVSLLEISKQQRNDTELVIDKLDNMKSELTVMSESVIKESTKKERALQSGLGRKINSFISLAVRDFILVATKAPPHSIGSTTEKELIIQYMNNVQELIDLDFPLVNEDFYKIPINSFSVIDNNNIPTCKDLKLDVYYILYKYKVDLTNKVDDLMRYSALIPDNFFITMMELMDFIDCNPAFTTYNSDIYNIIKNARPAFGFDMAQSNKTWCERWGRRILALKEYIY